DRVKGWVGRSRRVEPEGFGAARGRLTGGAGPEPEPGTRTGLIHHEVDHVVEHGTNQEPVRADPVVPSVTSTLANPLPYYPKLASCGVCHRPDVDILDAADESGQSMRSSSKQHRVPFSNLLRHRRHRAKALGRSGDDSDADSDAAHASPPG